MRRLIFLALFAVATPASAQLVAPLTTSDGKIACTQGSTGVGRAARWEAVADKAALGGWALAETAGDATDLRFPLCVSTQTVARDVDATLRARSQEGTGDPGRAACAARDRQARPLRGLLRRHVAVQRDRRRPAGPR